MKDPNICLSVVNTLLRDKCKNLNELNDYLIDVYNMTSSEVIERIAEIGYSYNEELNQFVAKSNG